MRKIKAVNTEHKEFPAEKNEREGSTVWWKIVAVLLILVGIGAFMLAGGNKPGSSSVFNYVLGRETTLEEDQGRINVLLLGMAGGKHDGATLTDTIMVVSYDLKAQKAVLISLPRDLWISKHQAKVNTLYQTGLGSGQGLQFAREEIGQLLGLKIPYAVRVDFAGFTKAVDLVEGLDVGVARSFDDYFYPVTGKENDLCEYKEEEVEIDEEKAKELNIKAGRIKVLLDKEGKIATAAAEPGKNIIYTDDQANAFFACRFEHLSFKKGLVHMDGETSLKYVRSRHGLNGEGSDFARSKRQQQVLQAFKNKILSFKTLLDVGKIVELGRTFGKSVESDIPQDRYLDFVKLVQKTETSKSVVIDASGTSPLLITPTEGNFGGAWVLMPPDDDFSRIQQFIKDSFLDDLEATKSANVLPTATDNLKK